MKAKKAIGPKIVIVNGSLHGDTPNSNTSTLLRLMKVKLRRLGAEVVLISPEEVTYTKEGGPKCSMYVLDTGNPSAGNQP